MELNWVWDDLIVAERVIIDDGCIILFYFTTESEGVDKKGKGMGARKWKERKKERERERVRERVQERERVGGKNNMQWDGYNNQNKTLRIREREIRN